jgi:hypothetical protein
MKMECLSRLLRYADADNVCFFGLASDGSTNYSNASPSAIEVAARSVRKHSMHERQHKHSSKHRTDLSPLMSLVRRRCCSPPIESTR